MGVVRREGDWRLEKRSEGVYEITFRRESQMKILTSNAPSNRNGVGFDAVPLREVSSYSEAEGLFEEKAHGPTPLGMQPTAEDTYSGSDSDVDLTEFPPYGIGAMFLTVGLFMLYAFWDSENTLLPLFGVGALIVGVTPFVFTGYLYRTEDWQSAWEFLVTPLEDRTSSDSSSSKTKKTPPTPEKLKNKLIFDRSGQRCEWCEESYDHLQVHHIKPRREGGPNDPENLIVLCPNCHENADREAIPRSKLKAKVKRLPEISAD
ncbi:HNH endonuclease [Halobacteria archaeon HArc-gm2]|nr:HNH endonuclease [Halobacteria archaeon HArc-gm2]